MPKITCPSTSAVDSAELGQILEVADLWKASTLNQAAWLEGLVVFLGVRDTLVRRLHLLTVPDGLGIRKPKAFRTSVPSPGWSPRPLAFGLLQAPTPACRTPVPRLRPAGRGKAKRDAVCEQKLTPCPWLDWLDRLEESRKA